MSCRRRSRIDSGREFAWLGAITGPSAIWMSTSCMRTTTGPAAGTTAERPVAFFRGDEAAQEHGTEKACPASQIGQNTGESCLGLGRFPQTAMPSASETGIFARRPIIDPARAIIWRRFSKVIKDGRAIGPSSPAGRPPPAEDPVQETPLYPGVFLFSVCPGGY